MELNTLKYSKLEFKRTLFSALIQLIIGVLLFFLKLENTIGFFTIMFGIYFIVVSAIRLLIMNGDKTIYGQYTFVSAIVYLILGILLVVFQTTIVSIIAAIFLVILPIIRIILSNDKMEMLKREVFNLVIGVFVLLFGFAPIIVVVRYVAGTIVILFAIFNLISAILVYNKVKKSSKVIDAEIKELK